MGEMHADLMGAPGLQRAFDQRGDRLLAATESLDHAPMGHGLASFPGSTAILVRLVGWRPIGASMVPCGRDGAPQTSAR